MAEHEETGAVLAEAEERFAAHQPNRIAHHRSAGGHGKHGRATDSRVDLDELHMPGGILDALEAGGSDQAHRLDDPLRKRLDRGVRHGPALDRDARVRADSLADGCVEKPTAEVGEGGDAVLGSCHVLLHQRIFDVAQEEAQLGLAGYAVYVAAPSASTGLDDARPRPLRVASLL